MGEQAWTQSWKAPRDHPAETTEVLYLKYHGYRRRQAARLLHVMPREAVRELYGEAREWAQARGLHDIQDPMATLVRFAEHLLPLPPFEVWLADREQYPLCHIEDSNEGPHAASMGAAGTVGRPALQLRGPVLDRIAARLSGRRRVARLPPFPSAGQHPAPSHGQHLPRGNRQGGAAEVQGSSTAPLWGRSCGPFCPEIARAASSAGSIHDP